MVEIESSIRRCRHDLDLWLASSYAGREPLKYYGENDASYPQWGTIEDVVGSVFDNQSMQQLEMDCQESILFFISRSDEIGRIISWLIIEPGSSLSSCGRLSESDFLFLCEKSLDLPCPSGKRAKPDPVGRAWRRAGRCWGAASEV